ncbi:MAG: PTS sugar transporter subunit IIC [Culicoidibacterales bacterium]
MMNKIEKFLSKWLLPLASKLEANKPLAAVRRGMMILVPVTLVGSVPILFQQLPGIPGMPQILIDVLTYLGKVTGPIQFATFGVMALYVAALTGYYYAEQKDVWNLGGIVVSLISFISVATIVGPEGVQDFTYYGGQGIFTALVLALLSVQILHIFKNKLGFTINLGDGVPTPILRSFENLWPILFSVLIITAAKFGVETLTGTPVVKLIELVFSPLTLSVNSLTGIIIILLIQQLLWWFGIHGYSVMAPLWMPVAFANADANAAMLSSGKAFSDMFIFTPDFMWNLAGVTGSGVVGAVVILMLFSKSERFKKIGRISIIPEFFGIGEPALFGLPVVLNPIMFIPWMLSAPIAAAMGWFAIKLQLMNPFVIISPYVPLPVGGLIATMDWRYVLVAGAIIGVMVLLYYPFFKIVEKQVLIAEKVSGNSQESLDDIDFDF